MYLHVHMCGPCHITPHHTTPHARMHTHYTYMHTQYANGDPYLPLHTIVIECLIAKELDLLIVDRAVLINEHLGVLLEECVQSCSA